MHLFVGRSRCLRDLLPARGSGLAPPTPQVRARAAHRHAVDQTGGRERLTAPTRRWEPSSPWGRVAEAEGFEPSMGF